jgi:hypothetical protein
MPWSFGISLGWAGRGAAVGKARPGGRVPPLGRDGRTAYREPGLKAPPTFASTAAVTSLGIRFDPVGLENFINPATMSRSSQHIRICSDRR